MQHTAGLEKTTITKKKKNLLFIKLSKTDVLLWEPIGNAHKSLNWCSSPVVPEKQQIS